MRRTKDDDSKPGPGVSRRELLAAAAAGLAASAAPSAAAAAGPAPRSPAAPARRPFNILFVFTDQERYFRRVPKALELPGRDRLRRTGVTFHQHYISATMCTPSRSVLMTGLQTPDSRMFENTNVPWVKDLAPDVPTLGHLLRKAGYHAAYKGKWHLNRTFDQGQPTQLFTREMEAYGFSDYASPGDVVGHTLGGYHFDHLIGGSAITWLRSKGRPLSDQGTPWCLVVSLVNPHDIMYFNADAPGERVQDTGRLLARAARAPDTPAYRRTWNEPLPSTLGESLQSPGRPPAHREYQRAWDHVLGEIPPEPARWRRFGDFYLNSLRGVDAQVAGLLSELDALRLTDRTIVVFTADHGEMGGAHGLRGKGPFTYEEAIHVPLQVVHPDVRGGQDCRALTSHIDLVPTFLAMAGVPPGKAAELAGRALPGKDLTPLLSRPAGAQLHAARQAVLFTYSGLGTNDSELIRRLADALAAGKDPKTIQEDGFAPDLRKRGTVRAMFDGRYKFARYLAPVDRHRPATLDELRRHNDLELFDLQQDPGETRNLAATPGQHDDLVLTASARLEAVLAEEIGVDDGREMPELQKVQWTLQADRMD